MGIILWLLAIFSYPFLIKIKSPVAPFLHLSFSFVCHQKAERCFWIKETPLPVCSRCTGIYTGFFAGVVFFPFLRKNFSIRWYYILLSAFPISLEIVMEKMGVWDGNWIRFFSSLLFGFFISSVSLWSLENQREKR